MSTITELNQLNYRAKLQNSDFLCFLPTAYGNDWVID